MPSFKCNRCEKNILINRHSIQDYNFSHIDDNIEGDYVVKCPHCDKTHVVVFTAQITLMKVWSDELC